MSFHNAEVGYSIHTSNAFTYANAAARTGASGLVLADNGKIALQSDTMDYYILTDYTGPTWKEITGGGGGSSPVVVSNFQNGTFVTNASTSTFVSTGLTVTTTASSSISPIMISAVVETEANNSTYIKFQIYRDATIIYGPITAAFLTSGGGQSIPLQYVDVPGDTSPHTYTIGFAPEAGGVTAYVLNNSTPGGQGTLIAIAF
jgi:hypothetical protein